MDRRPRERLGEEDEELASVDDRVAVSEMLSVLPEREQTIVYLRFFEGLTQSEIAERGRHQPDARVAAPGPQPGDAR